MQIERLHGVLECTEVSIISHELVIHPLIQIRPAQYAVLVREDATRRHQEHLKAAIEPQVQELLRMAEERRMERERLAEKMKRRVRVHFSSTGTN